MCKIRQKIEEHTQSMLILRMNKMNQCSDIRNITYYILLQNYDITDIAGSIRRNFNVQN